jgi:hypothetical protein
MDRRRFVAGVGGVVAGLVLVVGTFAVGGFGAAAAGERLLDMARPELTEEGLAALRADLTTAGTAGQEIQTQLVPAYAAAEGLTVEQFTPVLAARYPLLAAAGAEGEATLAFTDRAVTNLEAHQDDFEKADDIPVPGLPLSVAPVFTLVFGVALIAGGALIVRASRREVPTGNRGVWTLAVIGALLVVFTLASGTPGKIAAADDLIDSLNITEQSAIETRQRLEVQLAGAEQFESEALPDLQRALRMSDAAFDAALRASAPTVASLRGRVPEFLTRFEVDVVIREQGHDEFAAITDAPTHLVPWLYVVGGTIAVAAAAPALLARARRRQPSATAVPSVPVS